MAGWFPLFASGAAASPLLSQRNVINLNSVSEFDYGFINHYLPGDSATSFVGADFFVGSKTWPQVIDTDGWPNDPSVNGVGFGNGIRIPKTTDYTGTYTITWTGDGSVQFGGGTWTVNAGLSSNYTEVGNGWYSNTSGLVPTIVVTVTGLATHPNLIGVTFKTTDPGATGAYLKAFKFYRTGDEARLLAGKVFRTAFLDLLATLNPSAIRFLNWHGGNSSKDCRFENRLQPASSGVFTNWTTSPKYGVFNYTNANQYTLAAVSTGAKQTPVSMTHGEVVTARTGSDTVRSGTGFKTIVGITKFSPGVVNMVGHGFATGDTIIHLISAGMTQLDRRPCVITVVDADHYSIGIDTTGYSTFTAGTGNQYVSLNVGARGTYPVMFQTGQNYASDFGDGYFPIAGQLRYKTFVFNKNVYAIKDASGNPIYGVWLFNNLNGGGYDSSVPIEICTALVNEVNERVTALGYSNPVHMWVNMPHMGMTSMDPDYSAASNFAVKTTDVILNGANGYAGLTSTASVIVEHSNEIWNFGGGGFSQTYFLCRQGAQRWPASGDNDAASMSALRSVVMVRDIKAAFPGNARLKYTLGAQGSIGYSAANQLRSEGTSYYLADALVTGGGYGTPISNHDAMNHAAYFDAYLYYNTQITTDSALYASGSQSAAIASFVSAIVNQDGSGQDQTTNMYCNPSSPTAGLDSSFAVAMASFGKKSIQYEGGPDWHVLAGTTDWFGHVITSADQTFLTACTNSAQWSSAQIAYFNARSGLTGVAMPSVYIFLADAYGDGSTPNQRWSYASPDTYVSGVEGQALLNNAAWVAMGVRNRGLSG